MGNRLKMGGLSIGMFDCHRVYKVYIYKNIQGRCHPRDPNLSVTMDPVPQTQQEPSSDGHCAQKSHQVTPDINRTRLIQIVIQH